ncbi:hypothetical protein KAH27_04260, partial [bacterium]|nr:hypothetical protein [bacterium]
MIKTKVTIFLALVLFSQFAMAQNLNISGFARTYEGVKVNNGDFSIVQQTLNLNFEKRGNKVTLKANPMAYLYNQDSL